MLNLAHKDLAILIEEGGDADEEFIDENSDSPPVHGFVVTCMGHHFRAQILRCATIASSYLIILQHLGQTVIDNFNVASRVDHDILKL